MTKIKGNISILICIMLMFSTVVFANNSVENKDGINDVFKVIKKQLVDRYGKIYKLDNFQYDYIVREEGTVKYVDMDIYADMTLMRPPSESPFVQGMKEALLAEEDKANKKIIEKEIELYLEATEEYYKMPNRSTFKYTIAFDNNAEISATSTDNGYKLFSRTDAEDEIVLIAVENLAEVENSVVAKEKGHKAAQDAVNREPELTTLATFTYDRIAARDWARANAFATPEYPSSIVGGTDCANFVSKALHAGGIPEDSAGNWYGSSTWGGWSGTNWLRTGYYNNGGVVPYMTGKDYFYKQSDESKVFAGSIMYWNATSHVALVTYGDGTTIKYTQHGATQSKDTVYETENASFYMPSTTIMN